jgi:hypothetical protein
MGVLVAVVLGSSGLRADPLPAPLVHWTFDGGAATNCGSGGDLYDAVVSGAVAYTNGLADGGLLPARRQRRVCGGAVYPWRSGYHCVLVQAVPVLQLQLSL